MTLTGSTEGYYVDVPYTKEEEKPSGWHGAWNRSGATIIYADETT